MLKNPGYSFSWLYFPEEQNIKAKHNYAVLLGVPQSSHAKFLTESSHVDFFSSLFQLDLC